MSENGFSGGTVEIYVIKNPMIWIDSPLQRHMCCFSGGPSSYIPLSLRSPHLLRRATRVGKWRNPESACHWVTGPKRLLCDPSCTWNCDVWKDGIPNVFYFMGLWSTSGFFFLHFEFDWTTPNQKSILSLARQSRKSEDHGPSKRLRNEFGPTPFRRGTKAAGV
jgi:hypothetical protein